MTASAADVSQIVEYTMDRRVMNKVPWAMLACTVGLFFLLIFDERPANAGLLKAFIVLALVVSAFFVTALLFEQMSESDSLIVRIAAIVCVVVALIVIDFVWALTIGGSSGLFRRRASSIPANVLGWAFVVGGVGFITFALFKHVRPGRPVIALSPQGIAYHGALVKKLTIPWHEVKGVDGLQYPGSPGFRFPDATVVLLSRDFYERNIAGQYSILRGPRKTWDAMFVPKGDLMQMVLHYIQFGLDPKDVREPIEARWKAFHDAQPSPQPVSDSHAPKSYGAKVYGAWLFDGSLLQIVWFALPLVVLVAVLLHSTGMFR